jgi:hypothetical protein
MDTLETVYKYAHTKNRDGIIIDTVVLLLYFIGKLDTEYIQSFKPTRQYTKADFELVNKIISPFKRIIATPQIIAEVSNHSLVAIHSDRLHHYFAMITNFLNNKDKVEEGYLRFEEWDNKSIARLCSFGFVDLGMYELSKRRGVPILTDDLTLYIRSKEEIPVIKLSVIKDAGYSGWRQ